jgi:hypothetical protein
MGDGRGATEGREEELKEREQGDGESNVSTRKSVEDEGKAGAGGEVNKAGAGGEVNDDNEDVDEERGREAHGVAAGAAAGESFSRMPQEASLTRGASQGSEVEASPVQAAADAQEPEPSVNDVLERFLGSTSSSSSSPNDPLALHQDIVRGGSSMQQQARILRPPPTRPPPSPPLSDLTQAAAASPPAPTPPHSTEDLAQRALRRASQAISSNAGSHSEQRGGSHAALTAQHSRTGR